MMTLGFSSWDIKSVVKATIKIKRRERYEKPSVKRKRKSEAARKRKV